MNATMVASGTKAVPPVVSSIQDIPLVKIRESKTNPRRAFDDARLAELAENIKQHGVLQPILELHCLLLISARRSDAEMIDDWLLRFVHAGLYLP